MKKIELLNGSLANWENIQAPANLDIAGTPLAESICAKFGACVLAQLQAKIDATPNRQIAYFWAKYATKINVANLEFKATKSINGKCCGRDIFINVKNDFNSCECHVTIHEGTHAIDSAFTSSGFKYNGGSRYSENSGFAGAEFSVNGEKITFLDAIAADKARVKAALKDEGENEIKIAIQSTPPSGYDLTTMVLGGKDRGKHNEFFAELAAYSITSPRVYASCFKKIMPNVVSFFETLIEYLTPEYNPASIHVIRAKAKYNNSGKLLLNFNGKYSIAQMMERLQTLGGLSFKAAYSTLARAVKYGWASQSTLEIEEAPSDYDTAQRSIRNLAKSILMPKDD